MDALLFSDAAEAAFYRIVGDFFGLLPFFFAYTIYRDVLNRSKDTGSLAHWSKAKHVLIAAGIVAIFAFATGQRCPVDEFGYYGNAIPRGSVVQDLCLSGQQKTGQPPEGG